jgi:hypothetical protein
MQYDDASAHVPPVQRPEQQSPFPVQELPLVRQLGFRGLQSLAPPSPAGQLPPQHWLSALQGWLSEMHWVAPHAPPMQVRVQQSVGAAHFAPAGAQALMPLMHVFVFESQTFEQQSPLATQANPAPLQAAPSPPSEPSPFPSSPASTVPSSPPASAPASTSGFAAVEDPQPVAYIQATIKAGRKSHHTRRMLASILKGHLQG